MNRSWAAFAGTATLALLATGCTSATEESGIVRLDDSDSGTATVAAVDAGTAEEQAIAFAQCMRDNGVDFPDPTVDADGSPIFSGAFGGGEEGEFDPQGTSFQDAMTACGDLLEGLTLGGGRSFDSDTMNEALYAYTQCLRDEGLDVGDITLDGMMGAAAGGQASAGGTATDGTASDSPALADGEQPAAPAAGERSSGGVISDLFAEQLGQDADDPAWIAANETCQPVLEDAMSGVGSA